MTAAEQIRALLQARADALHARDTPAAVAPLADDVVTYDLDPPLAQAGGRGHDHAGLERWFATWRSPIAYRLGELTVVAEGDVAFSYSLNQISGTKADGAEIDLWFRSTVCLRRIEGAWRIVHEHASTPFSMDGSQRAALDLKP